MKNPTPIAAERTTNTSGFHRMFAQDRLTLGVFFPIEAFQGDRPTMNGQEALAKRAEALGLATLWFRDVPLRVPCFGDVGQVFETFTYLSWIAAHTRDIALATGAVVLPLRHPLLTAKQAASVDRLSNGRLVMGVASGDRPEEFPAFGQSLNDRGDAFRENLAVMRTALEVDFPRLASDRYGTLDGSVDLVPKPLLGRLPMLAVGSSRQEPEWLAANTDGLMTYPRGTGEQAANAAAWRAACDRVGVGGFKPFGQSLYLDLGDRADERAVPMHLGFRCGRDFLLAFLEALEGVGVAHVALNLKYSRRHAGEVLDEIGEHLAPRFPHHGPATPAHAKPGSPTVTVSGGFEPQKGDER